MSNMVEINQLRHKRALTNWLRDCKRRMRLKFPAINFESSAWPIKTLYKTKQPDLNLTPFLACFESKDSSFKDVVRGLAAEIVVRGEPKSVHPVIKAFCLLGQCDAQSVFEITLNDLKKIEDASLIKARTSPASAEHTGGQLVRLKTHTVMLEKKGVIPWLGFRPRREVKSELRKLARINTKSKKSEKSTVLDHKIEAFNDALNALYDDDPRLSPADRMAIALGTRSMCAPSRINEVLCSSVDDHVTVEDYAHMSPSSEFDSTYRAHQMLLITMKGSKGASWGAKPALNFMIDAFNYSTDVIKQLGKQSRTLIEWYQLHPDTLYLPAELEFLRGKDLGCSDLAKIVHLTNSPSVTAIGNVREWYFNPLKEFHFMSPTFERRGPRKLVSFKDAENFLLQKVRFAIEACRKVTHANHYEGDLSKMLCLFDGETTPYLPGVFRDGPLRRCLKGSNRGVSLFQKLGITMPVNGKVEVAWIDTHDPRRWLTTQALRHGEKLSDVLINKWANRLKLAQLEKYDFRSAEELASSSRMPVVQELTDLSGGIERVNKLEESFGLQSAIVTVPDAQICLTSMDLVVASIEDRPVARTSEQIIILYPSQFGVCLHQHHETPCRNYHSCLPCDDNIVVKGHVPSNDGIRTRSVLLHQSIVRQLDRLVVELNRGIADDPDSLAQHILTLVEKGLDSETMADYLIDEFHEVKVMLKDKLLVKRLEEAFVARGFVKLLDDEKIPAGALIKYHNPTYHAAPGLEKALDSHGGREQILEAELALIERFPQFAPKALGLKDERHLLTSDGEDLED